MIRLRHTSIIIASILLLYPGAMLVAQHNESAIGIRGIHFRIGGGMGFASISENILQSGAQYSAAGWNVSPTEGYQGREALIGMAFGLGRTNHPHVLIGVGLGSIRLVDAQKDLSTSSKESYRGISASHSAYALQYVLYGEYYSNGYGNIGWFMGLDLNRSESKGSQEYAWGTNVSPFYPATTTTEGGGYGAMIRGGLHYPFGGSESMLGFVSGLNLGVYGRLQSAGGYQGVPAMGQLVPGGSIRSYGLYVDFFIN